MEREGTKSEREKRGLKERKLNEDNDKCCYELNYELN